MVGARARRGGLKWRSCSSVEDGWMSALVFALNLVRARAGHWQLLTWISLEFLGFVSSSLMYCKVGEVVDRSIPFPFVSAPHALGFTGASGV